MTRTSTGAAGLALALLIAGCGTVHVDGSPSPSGGSDLAPLVAAASYSSKVTSMSFDATIKAAGQTIGESGSIALGKDLKAKLTVSVAGMSVDELLIGRTVYMHSAAVTAKTGKTWGKISVAAIGAKMGIDLDALFDQVKQQDPSLPLQLAIKSGEVKNVGTVVIDGLPATHYHGTIDISKATSAYPAALQAQIASLVTKAGVKNIVLDLWVSSKSRPLRVDETYDTNQGPASVVINYRGFDQPVDATVPPAADTADLDTLLGG